MAVAVQDVAVPFETDGRARKMGLTHGLMNVGATALFTASLAARRKGSRGAGRGLSTLGFLVFFGDPLVGVVGGVCMLPLAALAWRAELRA